MKIKNFIDVRAFLFNNTGIKQTIFKNTFWMGLGDGINKLLKLILLIYVAKTLGATEYGKFSFAFAFVGLFTALTVLGVPEIMVREFARDKKKEKDFSSIVSLGILLNLGTLILIFISSFFVTSNFQIQKIIWILAVYTSLDILTHIFCSLFRARQQMQYEAFAKIIQVLILASVGIFILFYSPSILNLSYGYLSANLVVLIFILLIFFLKFGFLKIKWNIAVWKRYLSMSWPLALVGFLTIIYAQIDSVMMGYWNQITQTGWYNAAYRIVGATLIPASLISLSFYPALSKIFKESKEKLQGVWNFQMEIMIFLALPVTIGGIILAPKIINFIYDSSYAPSIMAFQILIVMAGISIFSSPFQQALIVSDQQKKIFWGILIGVVINIFLNSVLIPRYSLYGAATATVITGLLTSFIFFKFVSKFTPIQPFSLKLFFSLIMVGFSSIIMYFVISCSKIYNLNVLLSIFIGLFVYFITFFGLKFTLKRINHYYQRI